MNDDLTLQEILAEILCTLHAIERNLRLRNDQYHEFASIMQRASAALAIIINKGGDTDDEE